MYPSQGQTAGPRCDLSAGASSKKPLCANKDELLQPGHSLHVGTHKRPVNASGPRDRTNERPFLCALEMPNESIQTDNLHRPPTYSAVCSSYGTGV